MPRLPEIRALGPLGISRPLRCTRASILLCLLVALQSSPAWPLPVVLGFDTRPSAQGWLYQGPPEDTVISVDGTTLTIDTVGSTAPPAAYAQFGLIDPSLPFTVAFTARVVQQ